jgi:hypothetical protein
MHWQHRSVQGYMDTLAAADDDDVMQHVVWCVLLPGSTAKTDEPAAAARS